jgi:hypothetical protein
VSVVRTKRSTISPQTTHRLSSGYRQSYAFSSSKVSSMMLSYSSAPFQSGMNPNLESLIYGSKDPCRPLAVATSGRKLVGSILFVNRLIHDEAEEALCKGANITLNEVHHSWEPLGHPVLHLSQYAYSAIRHLKLILSAPAESQFHKSTKPGRPQHGTWRFLDLALRLKNLKSATFQIYGVPEFCTRNRHNQHVGCARNGFMGRLCAS